MDNIKISVIIPHYNIPHLLGRCLRSIPSRQDIQVIVVDDCSPNAVTYKELIPELSKPNVEFYSTPKGGSAGRARNIGIDHARGKWLTFVDADDFLPKEIATIFDELADRTEDLIFTDFKSVMSDDLNTQSSRNDLYHEMITDYLANHDDTRLRYKFDSMWGKLVKKELVDKHHCRFSETRWSNDCYFAVHVGMIANSIYVDQRVGYILTEREGSLANNYCKTIAETVTRTEVSLQIRQLIAKNKPNKLKYSPLLFINQYILDNYGKKDRFVIAVKLWRYPKYMCHLLLSILK